MPRKQPRQARAGASCAAIEEATARILFTGLFTGGQAALITTRIAEVAGVSVGTLYRHSPTKQAIPALMIRRMRAKMLAELEVAAAEAGGDREAAVGAVVRASLAHHPRAGAGAATRRGGACPWYRNRGAEKARVAGVSSLHGHQSPDRAAAEISALVHTISAVALIEDADGIEAAARRSSVAVMGYLGAG